MSLPIVGSQMSSSGIKSVSVCLNHIEAWLTICDAGLSFHAMREAMDQEPDRPSQARKLIPGVLAQIQLENISLMHMEKALFAGLRALGEGPGSDYHAYCEADAALQHDVLFENVYKIKYKGAGTQGNDNQSRAGEVALLAAIDKKMVILERHPVLQDHVAAFKEAHHTFGFIAVLDNRGTLAAHHRRMASYLLSRNKDFYASVKSIIESEATFFKAHQQFIFKAVDQGSWFDMAQLEALLRESGKSHPALKAEQGISETYRKYQDELKSIRSQIQDHAFNAVSPTDTSPAGLVAREAYNKKYIELVTQRDISTQILASQRKELDCYSRIKESIKDYAAENLLDKKAAAKDFGKVLAVTAGKRLSIAIFNEIRGQGGKNDWSDIGGQLGMDLLEAGIKGAARFFLGPVGGSLGTSLMAFIRPTPDPYMDQLKGISDKIDAGFSKTHSKLDDISAKISDLSKEIKDDLKHWADYIVIKSDQNTRVTELERLITSARDMIFSIDDYALNFSARDSVGVQELIDLDDRIISAIQAIIREFYNEQYSLLAGVYDDASETRQLPLRKDSLAGKIISAASDPNAKAFQSFSTTIGQLSRICEAIRLLVSAFIQKRERYIQSLAISAVFFTSEKMPGSEVFTKICDIGRWRDSFTGELFAVAYQLDTLICGRDILTLKKSFDQSAATPAAFNLLSGFALLRKKARGADAQVPAEQLAFDIGCLKRSTHGTWSRQADAGADETVFWNPRDFRGWREDAPIGDHVHRYYLVPDHDDPETQQLFSFQKSDLPVFLRVRVALGLDQSLMLHHGEGFGKSISARVADLHDPMFRNSLEQLFLEAGSVTLAGGGRATVSDSYSMPDPNYRAFFWCGTVILGGGSYPPAGLAISRTREMAGKPLAAALVGLKTGHMPAGEKVRISLGVSASGAPEITLARGQEGAFKEVSSVTFPESLKSSLDFISPYLRNIRTRDGEYCVSNILLAPLSNIIAPGAEFEDFDGSTICQSKNGAYAITLDRRYKFDPVVQLRGPSGVKSVFEKYALRNCYRFVLRLQAQDGHLVIYENPKEYAREQAVTATNVFDKVKYAKSHMVLSDNGYLLQIAQDGSFIAEISCHDAPVFSYGYDKKTQSHLKNRLLPGDVLRDSQSIVSENGLYKLQKLDLRYSSLILCAYPYRGAEAASGSRHLFYHNDQDIKLVDKDDTRYVTMQKDGNLVAYALEDPGFWSKNREVAVTATGTHKNPGAFLVLTDEGQLEVWDSACSQVLHRIKTYES